MQQEGRLTPPSCSCFGLDDVVVVVVAAVVVGQKAVSRISLHQLQAYSWTVYG